METKTLSKQAIEVIEHYSDFKFGNTFCSIPYFNNKKTKSRAALRTYIGKGSPSDIKEELETIVAEEKIDTSSLNSSSLKKLLVDNNLGIECSGFCYHVLEAESKSKNKGSINKNITFVNCNGLVGKIRCSLRPVENCDVETFANDKNSTTISIDKILPGDIITMVGDENSKERNHILIIEKVEYENSIPKKIFYAHSIAYPEDGLYNTGIKKGFIEIDNPQRNLTEMRWIEEGKDNLALINRAKNSETQIRRLLWF